MGEEEGDNPLGFLDRLLDEERHSNLYFGDVRFWKHLENIDSSHIYRTSSLEYRTMKMMFCEGVFFMCFLFILTTYLVSEKAGDLFSSRRQQLDYWGGCNMQGETRICRIDSVKDIPTLMDWLRDDFAPLAFTDKTEYPSVVESTSVFRMQDGTMYWTPRYVGDTQTSVLIGSIRLRQVRVQYSKDCSILSEFQGIVDDCFADYNDNIQSRLPWAPAWTPEYLKEHYEWRSSNATEQRPYYGRYATYPGDGFVLNLPLNLTGAQTRFTELQYWKWIDQRTRALIIEMNTMNPNVNSFVHSRILFEFPAAGGIHISQEAFPFRALQLSLSLMAADDFGGSFIYLVMTCGFSLLFAIYNIFLVVKNGPSRFFSYFWSVVDVGSLIVWAGLLWLKLQTFIEADSMPNLKPEVIGDPEMFYPIGNIIPTMQGVVGLQGLLGLITWLRVLKYLTLSRTFLPFVRVFEKCFVGLLLYSTLLSVVLFGFAAAIYIGYGTETGIFSSLWSTFVSVAVAPAGGVDFAPLFANGDVAAPIIMFLYIIIVVLLVLTTFNAIQIDCYTVTSYQLADIKRHAAPGASGNPTIIFLWTYVNALKGVKLVGKETHEDIGDPEDQLIPLTSLPETVAVQYMATRKYMEKMIMGAMDQIEEEKIQRKRETGMPITDEDEVMARQKAIESAKRMGVSANTLALAEMSQEEIELEEYGEDQNKVAAGEMNGVMVNRVQLQRMLADDSRLVEVCSTHRAVEVMRRFRVDQSGEDPYEVVARLQASVTDKLKELEEKSAGLQFNEIETLRVMSQELHSALTESQKEWRAELLSVLQMASLLSTALIDLTRKLEQVQVNHTELAIRAAPLTLGKK